jgi:hypothetical protein
MALNQAWAQPWRKESHMSFQPEFHQAVNAVRVCFTHLGLPSSLSTIVATFLPRDWWPDSRVECFSRKCQNNQIEAKFASKRLGTPPAIKVASRVCTSGVATFCCEEHRQQHAMERQNTRDPPFRLGTDEDRSLTASVLGPTYFSAANLNGCVECNSTELGDQLIEAVDGSREILDDNNNNNNNNRDALDGGVTATICRFFEPYYAQRTNFDEFFGYSLASWIPTERFLRE